MPISPNLLNIGLKVSFNTSQFSETYQEMFPKGPPKANSKVANGKLANGQFQGKNKEHNVSNIIKKTIYSLFKCLF